MAASREELSARVDNLKRLVSDKDREIARFQVSGGLAWSPGERRRYIRDLKAERQDLRTKLSHEEATLTKTILQKTPGGRRVLRDVAALGDTPRSASPTIARTAGS